MLTQTSLKEVSPAGLGALVMLLMRAVKQQQPQPEGHQGSWLPAAVGVAQQGFPPPRLY